MAAVAGRSRGGGGGMVVLSRNRARPTKAVSKLSVPPPLNLPSLRKEHEKFDIAGFGGHGAGAGTGSGSRSTSSGVGWTKPAPTASQEKNENGVGTSGVDGADAVGGPSRAIGSHIPPPARSNVIGVLGSVSGSSSQVLPPPAEKAVVLRGEDFPSLQAARPLSSGASQKQKDGLQQKLKHAVSEESTQEKRDSRHLGPQVDMHPLGLSSRNHIVNSLGENGSKSYGVGSRELVDQMQKEDNFSDPLPLVNVNPRSDWADDERDTGHGLVDLGRDVGFSKPESYWDRDFDFPRHSAWPHKPAQSQYDKWGQRDNESGKKFSSEVVKIGQHKDVRVNNWEGSKWRNATFSKDGFNSQEVGSPRVDAGARMANHNNIVKQNKYFPPHSADIGRDGNFSPKRDPTFGRRDLDVVGQQQQQRHFSVEPFKRGSESRDSHVLEKPNSYKVDGFPNNTSSKSAIASRGKLPSIADPILTMGRDCRFSKSDRPFSDDHFLIDFDSAGLDERDIFSGGLVGVIKRKKDATRSTDFYDPVRESFEAELERVQKTQELERQRIIEEQEKVMVQARTEEEERQRKIREEEELCRKLEEEAQEAAWRAEQQRLEAVQRAEEQRIAREEEKRRMQLEEERRKQAAKQKLLELEARMAKREAEVGKAGDSVSRTSVDEKLEAGSQEKNITKNLDLDTWEDGERMVENVMASGSYDSSAISTSVDTSLKPYPFREGSSNFTVREKDSNSWRRDVFENGSSFPSSLPGQEIGHYSLKQDGFTGGRAALRKEFHGGSMPSRSYTKTGMLEPYSEEFTYKKDDQWGLSGNVSSFGKLREVDSEFPDSSMTDKYADNGWGQGQSPGNSHLSYPERFYPYSEDNEFYSYGRSRFSMRQPRVLPPPLGATQRTNFDGVAEHVDPSMVLDNSNSYTHAARIESTRQTDYYASNQVGHELSEIFGLQRENTSSEEPKLDNASRCESQSSLSVSSPPISPPHLSHDELDESGYSPVKSTVAEGKRSFLPVGESAAHDDNSRNSTTVTALDSVAAVEDEEWNLENDVRMQHQEEYDEDEEGYREEDELREGDEGNLELNQEFQGLELDAKEPSHIGHNVVIDFDEGVQVVIPSDDSEKNIGTQEASNGNSASSTCIMVERKSVDGFTSEQSALPAVDSFVTHEDSYSRQVSDKSAVQNDSVEYISSPYSSAAANPVEGAAATGSAIFTAQQNVSTSCDAATADSQTSSTSLSSRSQGDLPVKLQFGLFSGPSLIPSPVPAIQIGSIQMPLHIHPPVGPYIAHMHSSQPSMFQFGQVHYTSPVSQGILPIAPPTMAFPQPNVMGHVNQNRKTGGSVTHESADDASTRDVNKDEVQPFSINKMPSAVTASVEQSDRSLSPGLNTDVNASNNGGNSVCSSSSVVCGIGNRKMKSESGSQPEDMGHHHVKSHITPSKVRGPESQSHHTQPMMQTVGEKNISGPCSASLLPGGRGRRFAYKVKNTNTSSSSQNYGMPPESNGFQRRPRRTVQRTEFRVRESNDRRPASQIVSNNACLNDKLNYAGKTMGVLSRTGSKRGTITTRYFRQKIESASPAMSQNFSYGDRAKEANLSTKTQHASHYCEAKLRTASEEDVDAPLQSGVVRVFKQPGIEVPSDEDDFIEVRSKRQMLNNRREQREKEIKEKSRTTKPPRKPHTTRQKHAPLRGHDKVSISVSIEESSKSQFDFAASDGPQCTSSEVSTGFITTLSQHQKGTSTVNSEALDIKSHQVGSTLVVSYAKTEQYSGQISDSKNQVMSLSQTQIEEAMKPAQFDSISSVGSHSGTLSDPILPTSAILTKDKPYSSGASQINSLLAGEEIQFGAVTSPTVLPGSCVVTSHGSGIPSSKSSELQSSQNFSLSEKDNSLFAKKEKGRGDSSVPLQDCESEAEAAASAVAVAAISSDEISGNALGSVSKTDSFGATDVDGTTPGVVEDQHLAHQLHGEETLSVSLPADLSVEPTPISLWPPLPSPQSSSGQILSHFSGGPPSHFPFYEMNPLLGGPIFAFSPHEESCGTQSHAQKSTTSSSGPIGSWQQGHSGVDSFYGPHAGYAGPYIGSPGGIPGVQGPPHMVLYNHFTPVGQYGQVGLSFMGTTYIPSGKQADWKNLPASSAMPIGEGEMNNLKTTNGQRNAPPNMTAPIQHLAPGSPLLPTFDLSPFQAVPDLPVHTQWGHIPASHLHSAPLQPQGEGAVASQVNHSHPIDQSLPPSRFAEARTLTTSVSTPSFTVAADKCVDEFRELGLVGSIISTPATLVHSVTIQSSSGSPDTESVKIDAIEKGKNQNATFVKTKFSQKNASTQQGNNAGFGYQQGSTPQRTNTRNEWSHRRLGFHGRNRSTGVGKGYPAAKMKQIYVAKQTNTNSSTTT